MKRIFLTLALAVFAFSANAQFIISANIGGSTNVSVSGGLTVVIR